MALCPSSYSNPGRSLWGEQYCTGCSVSTEQGEEISDDGYEPCVFGYFSMVASPRRPQPAPGALQSVARLVGLILPRSRSDCCTQVCTRSMSYLSNDSYFGPIRRRLTSVTNGSNADLP